MTAPERIILIRVFKNFQIAVCEKMTSSNYRTIYIRNHHQFCSFIQNRLFLTFSVLLLVVLLVLLVLLVPVALFFVLAISSSIVLNYYRKFL